MNKKLEESIYGSPPIKTLYSPVPIRQYEPASYMEVVKSTGTFQQGSKIFNYLQSDIAEVFTEGIKEQGDLFTPQDREAEMQNIEYPEDRQYLSQITKDSLFLKERDRLIEYRESEARTANSDWLTFLIGTATPLILLGLSTTGMPIPATGLIFARLFSPASGFLTRSVAPFVGELLTGAAIGFEAELIDKSSKYLAVPGITEKEVAISLGLGAAGGAVIGGASKAAVPALKMSGEGISQGYKIARKRWYGEYKNIQENKYRAVYPESSPKARTAAANQDVDFVKAQEVIDKDPVLGFGTSKAPALDLKNQDTSARFSRFADTSDAAANIVDKLSMLNTSFFPKTHLQSSPFKTIRGVNSSLFSPPLLTVFEHDTGFTGRSLKNAITVDRINYIHPLIQEEEKIFQNYLKDSGLTTNIGERGAQWITGIHTQARRKYLQAVRNTLVDSNFSSGNVHIDNISHILKTYMGEAFKTRVKLGLIPSEKKLSDFLPRVWKQGDAEAKRGLKFLLDEFGEDGYEIWKSLYENVDPSGNGYTNTVSTTLKSSQTRKLNQLSDETLARAGLIHDDPFEIVKGYLDDTLKINNEIEIYGIRPYVKNALFLPKDASAKRIRKRILIKEKPLNYWQEDYVERYEKHLPGVKSHENDLFDRFKKIDKQPSEFLMPSFEEVFEYKNINATSGRIITAEESFLYDYVKEKHWQQLEYSGGSKNAIEAALDAEISAMKEPITKKLIDRKNSDLAEIEMLYRKANDTPMRRSGDAFDLKIISGASALRTATSFAQLSLAALSAGVELAAPAFTVGLRPYFNAILSVLGGSKKIFIPKGDKVNNILHHFDRNLSKSMMELGDFVSMQRAYGRLTLMEQVTNFVRAVHESLILHHIIELNEASLLKMTGSTKAFHTKIGLKADNLLKIQKYIEQPGTTGRKEYVEAMVKALEYVSQTPGSSNVPSFLTPTTGARALASLGGMYTSWAFLLWEKVAGRGLQHADATWASGFILQTALGMIQKRIRETITGTADENRVDNTQLMWIGLTESLGFAPYMLEKLSPLIGGETERLLSGRRWSSRGPDVSSVLGPAFSFSQDVLTAAGSIFNSDIGERKKMNARRRIIPLNKHPVLAPLMDRTFGTAKDFSPKKARDEAYYRSIIKGS